MFTAIALAASIEVFASIGSASWGRGDRWQQPPLASTYDGHTDAWQLGARYGIFELAYHNLGEANVRGTFVQDENYDAKDHRVKKDNAPRWAGAASQQSLGWTLQVAPRLSLGHGFSIQPSAGVLYMRQHESISLESQEYECAHYWSAGPGAQNCNRRRRSEMDFSATVGGHAWTPVVGLRALYTTGPFSVAAGAELYWKPATVNGVAGGKLRTNLVEVRYAIR